MTSGAWGLERCFRQYRQAKHDKAATASAPSAHQSQSHRLGISSGALMSRMSPAASEFVVALLVPADGAGMSTAAELVFIGRRGGESDSSSSMTTALLPRFKKPPQRAGVGLVGAELN